MNRWIKRAALALGGAAAVVVLAVAGVYGFSSRMLSRSYALPESTLTIPAADSAVLARGRHLAVAISKCVECHGGDLGGQVMMEDPAIGRLVAPNLTSGRGGVGGALTAEQWDHAVRHGVGADGRALLVMPAEDFTRMSDEDLGALVAYVRSVPAVDRELPRTRLGPLGRTLVLAGKMPIIAPEKIRHDQPRAPAPPAGPTAEYGAYLADIAGCTGCHGPGLSGGPIPGAPPEFPPATNLTPAGIGEWSEADFFTALRTGRRPDGSAIDMAMPWTLAAQMTDDETRAIWRYLQTVPARATGTR